MNSTGSSAKMATPVPAQIASSMIKSATLTTGTGDVYHGTPPMEKKEKKEKKANPWLIHVKAFRGSNPALSYKDVLKQAKNTYRV
jgi:hypothetical protein